MIIGIDASRANIAARTGTEWYAFSLIKAWADAHAFSGLTVRIYVREALVPDFPKLPETWDVRVLRWKPGVLWTQLRLSFELMLHPVDALFVPAHTIPLIHSKNTFTTLHDVGFERMRDVYNTTTITTKKNWITKRLLSLLVFIVTFGKYKADEYDYHRFSAKFALRHAKTIFTVSEFSKKEIAHFYPQHPFIRVVYNGLDPHLDPSNYTEATKNLIRKKYHLNAPFILALGRVERKKNSLALLSSFIEAKKQYRLPQHLVFIGSFGYGGDEVVEYVTSYAMTDIVHMLGWISQSESMTLLASADLFAMLSVYEGFGVPVLQSIALGTPVLASDLEVFHEIAGNIPLYTKPENRELTIKKIADICMHQQKYREQTLAASGMIREKFTWSKSADSIEKEIRGHLLAK